jgi:hypothetical protein
MPGDADAITEFAPSTYIYVLRRFQENATKSNNRKH